MLKQWQRNLCKLISPSMIARAVHQRLCGGNAGHSHLLTHMTAEAVMYVQMKKQQCVTANSMISYEQSAEQLPGQLPHQTLQPPPQAVMAVSAGALPYAAFEQLS